ncbi:uncharacterized protein LOC110448524 [Mizuhopecten yessoensis]|uniref:uncharacterized protein LOC110448524 n=1 Tax=Mizuhopecten yessoensis TaxID=6573 RepID=UPI000B459B9E|nr:uncharacterized protein LOC110448524 [Mizuhopecten yessoensis]
MYQAEELSISGDIASENVAHLLRSKVERLNYHKRDYTKISEKINDVNWTDLLSVKNVDESWKVLAETLSIIIKECIPVSKTKTDKFTLRTLLDRETVHAIRHKKTRWKKYLHCKDDKNWNEYKKARNQALKQIRTFKYNYERSMAMDIKSNSKTFWKYIRSKTKTKSTIGNIKDANGDLTSNNKDKAEIMNNYFTSVFTVETNEPLPVFIRRNYREPINDIDITEDKILSAIKLLNPNKSSGPDLFHPKLLLESANELVTPINHLLKKSLNEGKLPQDWKNAIVTPYINPDPKPAQKITDQSA